jgi:hypothetical protein
MIYQERKMDGNEDTITLLVPSEIDVEEQYEDSEGGEETGFKEQVQKFIGPKATQVNKKKLKEGILAAVKNVATVVDDIDQVDMKDWKIDKIEISLGITTTGTVGIVSVGMESSVKISFAQKPSTKRRTNPTATA